MKKIILTALAIAGFSSIASAQFTSTIGAGATIPGITGVALYYASVNQVNANTSVFNYYNTPAGGTPPSSLSFGTLVLNPQFSTFGVANPNTLGANGSNLSFYIMDVAPVGGAGNVDTAVTYTEGAGSSLGSNSALTFFAVTPGTQANPAGTTTVIGNSITTINATGSGSVSNGVVTRSAVVAAAGTTNSFLRIGFGLNYFDSTGTAQPVPNNAVYSTGTPGATNPQTGTFTFTFTAV